MKKMLCVLLAGLCLPVLSQTNIADHLQEVSVTIRSGGGEGSGVIFTRTNAAGAVVNFVWTAGHVIADLRTEREMVNAEGSKRTVVEFRDPRVVKVLVENGRTVGLMALDAEVIKYSDSENGHDVALLRLRKAGYIKSSVLFYAGDKPVPLGTPLYHVGSLLGTQGANSFTSGIMSQHGRLVGKMVFDQTTVVAFPGSSGGGVWTAHGEWVGMLVRGAGETFNLTVPVRRLRTWAKAQKVEWAIDHAIALPGEDELAALPVEDSRPKPK